MDYRGSNIMYQSLSYSMIKDLLDSKYTPARIKIWIYFSILQKYGKKIYAKNNYISKKLNIPLGTVKYAISQLKNDGLIEIINSGSWLRQIKLTKVANINENDNKEIKDRNEYEYHTIYSRVRYKDNLYLTQTEYEDLKSKLDDKTLEYYLSGMDTYLSNSQLRYTSHYQLLLIWIEKNDIQTKQKKKKYDQPDYKWYMTLERGYLKDKKQQDNIELFDYDWLNDDFNEE